MRVRIISAVSIPGVIVIASSDDDDEEEEEEETRLSLSYRYFSFKLLSVPACLDFKDSSLNLHVSPRHQSVGAFLNPVPFLRGPDRVGRYGVAGVDDGAARAAVGKRRDGEHVVVSILCRDRQTRCARQPSPSSSTLSRKCDDVDDERQRPSYSRLRGAAYSFC